jgi:octanoyl-[GcvH]:protein N-octanoyltransferase
MCLVLLCRVGPMKIVQDSLNNVGYDRKVTALLTDFAMNTSESVLRVWTPPKQVAFGRRDTIADGYDYAQRIATQHGYEPVERRVGGSAVAYTGHTVAFATAIPTDSPQSGVKRRYSEVTRLMLQTLRNVGATVTEGEPSNSFCPGQHSIMGKGKIVGIAQRIQRNCVLVAGCVIVQSTDSAAISTVLNPIYSALDLSFEKNSVGSVAEAGGSDDVDRVISEIKSTFTPDQVTESIKSIDILNSDTL